MDQALFYTITTGLILELLVHVCSCPILRNFNKEAAPVVDNNANKSGTNSFMPLRWRVVYTPSPIANYCRRNMYTCVIRCPGHNNNIIHVASSRRDINNGTIQTMSCDHHMHTLSAIILNYEHG